MGEPDEGFSGTEKHLHITRKKHLYSHCQRQQHPAAV